MTIFSCKLYGANFFELVRPNKEIIGISAVANKWPQPVSFEIPKSQSLANKIV